MATKKPVRIIYPRRKADIASLTMPIFPKFEAPLKDPVIPNDEDEKLKDLLSPPPTTEPSIFPSGNETEPGGEPGSANPDADLDTSYSGRAALEAAFAAPVLSSDPNSLGLKAFSGLISGLAPFGLGTLTMQGIRAANRGQMGLPVFSFMGPDPTADTGISPTTGLSTMGDPQGEATFSTDPSEPGPPTSDPNAEATFSSDPSESTGPVSGDPNAEGITSSDPSEGTGDGGGAGAGATVICTALHRRNLISDEIFAYNDQYRAQMDWHVYRGYVRWAAPFVTWASKSHLRFKLVYFFTRPLIDTYMNQIAAEMRNEKGTMFGRFILHNGLKICKMLGGKK